MKLENLSVGMRIPNYKKLCELLDIPVKAGNSKTAQLNELSRYCSFAREGNAYIITEVRDVPIPYQDGRQRYVSLIEPILMKKLSYTRCDEVGLPWRRWYTSLGMVSTALYDENRCAKAVKDNYAHPYSLYMLKNVASQKLKNILTSSLNNMKNRGLIRYEAFVGIVADQEYRKASPDELAYLDDVRQRVMYEMGTEKISSIFLSPSKSKEYHDKVHEIIFREKSWHHSFNSLYVDPISDSVASDYFHKVDEETLMKELNMLVYNTIKHAAQNGYYKALDKITERWCSEDLDADKISQKSFTYPNSYMGDIEFLSDELLIC